MIVFVAHMPEAFRDRVQTRAFRLMVKTVISISTIHYPREENQCRIAGQVISPDYCVKGAFFSVMAQFRVRHIIRYRVQSLCLALNLFSGNKIKLSIIVHELLNEPGTGNPIYFDTFSRDPFHTVVPCSAFFISPWISR